MPCAAATRRITAALAVVVVAVGLAACGRRGEPVYTPAGAGPAQGDPVAERPKASEPAKPKQHFLLDPLL